MAEMEVQGAEELIARFTKIGRLSTVKAGMGQACAIVERAAKEKAPKSSGALRRSITSAVEETGTEIAGVISTPLEYAPYVEYGTGLFAEGGNGRKGGWTYADDKGDFHFTNGQRPQPYMRPALNENRNEIVSALGEGILSD